MSRLTKPQERVVRFLEQAGPASSRAVARMLWGTPRQHERARQMLVRLAGFGVVERYSGGGGRGEQWCLVDGKEAP